MDTPPATPTTRKRIPISLWILLATLLALCVYIAINMLEGIRVFNAYKPDTEHLAPPPPGFP
ncbi:MAG: hypothetical protein OEW11_03675 [Nitrospirota bacterium]|nr:hypothetical protein [Nitrospirota bacterium]